MARLRGHAVRALPMMLLVVTAALAPAAAGAGEPPAILLLASYHRSLPWTEAETGGILEVLQRRWPDLQPYVEYLDRKRFAGPDAAAITRRFLREKYAGIHLDGLIVTDDAALDFALAERDGPLSGLPLAFCGVNADAGAKIAGRPRATGVVEEVDAAGTFSLVLALQPEVRTILVLLDATDTSDGIRPRVEAAAAALAGRVEVRVEGPALSHAELDRRVAALDRRTAVVLGSFNRDREGTYASYEAVAARVSALSGAPVYGLWDFQLGHGPVGGSVLGGAAQGRRAAELLLALLEGGGPVAVDRGAAAYLAVDDRALRRFGLDAGALGGRRVQVLNRPERVWEAHLGWSVGASVALLALLSFSGVLLVVLRRTRRTRAQLAESEDRNRTILDSVEDAIFIHDARSGEVLGVNRRACEMYGATAEAIRRGGLASLSSNEPPYTAEEAGRWMARATEEGPQRFEWHARRSDGTLFWVEVAIRASTVGGQPRLVVAARDIEHRKASEQALLESERRFRELANLLPQVIYEADAQGRLTFVNQRALEMFGVASEAALLGRPAVEFVVRGEREKGSRALARGLSGEVTGANEYLAVRADGATVPVMTYSTPILRGGQVVGLRGLVVDISERKKAEAEQAALHQRLEEAQRLESIGRLAGGVAHDFNNLLTPILGNAEAALSELGPDHPLAADLRGIVEAAERAGGLTSQLLAFGRRQVLRDRRLDLNAEVEALHGMLRRTIGEDVEVRLSLEPGLWAVRGDPSQIHQVLLNLAVNARDAMPRGGVLSIATRNVPAAAAPDRAGQERPRDLVELTVTDSGVGIPDEVRARLFEPFFTTKGPGRGTGLGLSTVLGVVQQHGGEIEVRSAPGEGATFRVLLPRNEAPEAAAPVAPAVGTGRPQEAARRAGTILVAEDEPGVRRLVEAFLRGAGHEVLVAPDGAQALALAAGHAGRLDLLLTDVVMPGMNGRELHQALCRGRPGLPVLYMSGYPALPSTLQDIVDGERDEFIAKPFTRAQLLARVEALLRAGV